MEYQKDLNFGHGFIATFSLLYSAYVPANGFSLICLHLFTGKGMETLEGKAFPDFEVGSE